MKVGLAAARRGKRLGPYLIMFDYNDLLLGRNTAKGLIGFVVGEEVNAAFTNKVIHGVRHSGFGHSVRVRVPSLATCRMHFSLVSPGNASCIKLQGHFSLTDISDMP